MKNKKANAVAGFLLVGIFWLATIRSNHFGFVPIAGAHSIGFDFFTLFMYALFLFTIVNLFRKFRSR
jgi:hypothetical protein